MKYSDDQGLLIFEHPMRSEEIVIFFIYMRLPLFPSQRKRKTNILIEKKQERIIYLRESEC